MITVTRAGKEFEGRWVFRDVSLEVAPGETAALVGPSGSGKSVLLKMIAGLISPSEGDIQVGSQNLGMLFQKNALFDSFTVIQNLLFPLKERQGKTGKEARELALQMLRNVGLESSESLYPSEISGGMQKRLGIARALIVSPEVILYDEPTAGLDPVTSRTIAELIRSLQKNSGSTLLTVTNDMNRAYQLGDRIYLLAQGKLREGGTPEQTRGSKDPAIQQFIRGERNGPLSTPQAEAR